MRWLFYASVPIAVAIAISCSSSKESSGTSDAGSTDGGATDGGAVADSESADAGPLVCPPTEPHAGDPCDWPAPADPSAIQCPYEDKCMSDCKEGATCVNGAIALTICQYSLACPNAAPAAKDHCLCGAGYYSHIPGEGKPCSYKCENDGGHYVALCDESTDEWIVSASNGCVPIAMDAGPGAMDADTDASDTSDAGTD
jgi:hypothetical protein